MLNVFYGISLGYDYLLPLSVWACVYFGWCDIALDVFLFSCQSAVISEQYKCGTIMRILRGLARHPRTSQLGGGRGDGTVARGKAVIPTAGAKFCGQSHEILYDPSGLYNVQYDP